MIIKKKKKKKKKKNSIFQKIKRNFVFRKKSKRLIIIFPYITLFQNQILNSYNKENVIRP